MAAELAGVALAAGAGTRLAPISDEIPKPLCEVATVPLIDIAIQRLRTVGADIAVNIHHHRESLQSHLGSSVRVSLELDEALGTAGAIGRLRTWVDGRPTVVVNADTWCPGSLEPLVTGWDGHSVRVLVPGGGDFGPNSPVVGTLLPWRVVRSLGDHPSGLYEVVWSGEQSAGDLEVVDHEGSWVDCGTPSELHRANMLALEGGSVIHETAEITGTVDRSSVSAHAVVGGRVRESVLFPGVVVSESESLKRAIRWRTSGGQQTLEV